MTEVVGVGCDTHTHIHTYTHLHIHTYTHIHTHVHTHTHTCAYTYTHTGRSLGGGDVAGCLFGSICELRGGAGEVKR